MTNDYEAEIADLQRKLSEAFDSEVRTEGLRQKAEAEVSRLTKLLKGSEQDEEMTHQALEQAESRIATLEQENASMKADRANLEEVRAQLNSELEANMAQAVENVELKAERERIQTERDEAYKAIAQFAHDRAADVLRMATDIAEQRAAQAGAVKS